MEFFPIDMCHLMFRMSESEGYQCVHVIAFASLLKGFDDHSVTVIADFPPFNAIIKKSDNYHVGQLAKTPKEIVILRLVFLFKTL